MLEIVPQTTILSNFPSPADLVTPLQCPLLPIPSLLLLFYDSPLSPRTEANAVIFLFFYFIFGFCFVLFSLDSLRFYGCPSLFLPLPVRLLLLRLLLRYFGVVTFNALL